MESDRHTIAMRDWERERTRERNRKVGGDGSYSLIFLCKSGLIQKTFSVHKSVITFQKSPN